MSNAILQGGASGTGQMTLLAPNTNSNRTVTFPDVDGQAMVSGGMPAFSAYRASSNQSLSQGWNKLQMNAEEFDTNNCYDSNSTYRFTPNVAGYYQISCGLALVNGSGPNEILISIYKNGSEFKRGHDGTTSTIYDISMSCLIYFNGTTDYIEMYTYYNSTANSLVASQVYSYFQGVMVRSA